jgi:hypothetical protein
MILALVVQANQLPEKGVPLLKNFYPNQYHNKGKIWDIGSATNGIVYMAADKGLLEYDGKTWNSFIGSNGFTRSLLIANDSLIYTGSDLDFGVWTKNEYNDFLYQSLYPFQQDIQQVSEEFWDVHQQNNNILFVSSQNIYVYANGQLTKIGAPSKITASFSINDTLLFADENNGLYIFENLSLKRLFPYPDEMKLQIAGVYRFGNDLGIVTRNSGLFVYSSGRLTPVNNLLSESLKAAKVFSFETVGTMHLAFGTVTRGLYIANLNGEIIHQINRQKGLPSNTILAIHYSPNGKLWLGIDYGVSSLHLINSLTYFLDYRGDFGTGYTALLKDDIFYLGTNQGLYRAAWQDLDNNAEFTRFQLIPGTEGQVWTLKNIDNTLLIGHDRGLMTLSGNTTKKLTNQEGVWTIIPYKNILLTGNYNGISILKKTGSQWQFDRKMELIIGSCNQLILEKDTILWINIPNFGIIKAPLDEQLIPTNRLIFEEDIFDGSNPYLLKTEKGIQVATSTQLYTFDESEQLFRKENKKMEQPKAEGLVSGIYEPLYLHPDYEFYPVYNGFALKFLADNHQHNKQEYQVIFRKSQAFNNHQTLLIQPDEKVPFPLNNFRIEYIVPNQDYVLYQFKTKESGPWSDWSSNNTTELLSLGFGQHTLWVRAQVNGELVEEQTITFRISAPWYHTIYAYGFYLFVLFVLILLVRKFQKVALKKQKEILIAKKQNALQKQAEKHQQEIMLMEQQQLQAEYNQLKQQLKNKTIELANKAREDEEKNRLLLTLKEKCDIAQNNPTLSKRQWNEMHRLLDSYLKVEDNTFEIQMDELHQEFFRKLKEHFPSLSNNDLRLCAYLKIGLNSKEIAEILNIQPSSSYISRSRLRKKLNLKAEEDLYDFLNGI